MMKTVKPCSCGRKPLFYKLYDGYNLQCKGCNRLFIAFKKRIVIGAWNNNDIQYEVKSAEQEKI